MNSKELDERIEKITRLHPRIQNNAYKQLIRECIGAVTPEFADEAYYTKHPVLWKPVEGADTYDAGFNQAAEVVRANTKELLDN